MFSCNQSKQEWGFSILFMYNINPLMNVALSPKVFCEYIYYMETWDPLINLLWLR